MQCLGQGLQFDTLGTSLHGLDKKLERIFGENFLHKKLVTTVTNTNNMVTEILQCDNYFRAILLAYSQEYGNN